MFLLRVLLPLFFLTIAGLVVAWHVTKDRKYLLYAWRVVQGALLLIVALGLVYVFERILLL